MAYKYPENLSNLKFSKLTVVKLLKIDEKNCQVYLCNCECGGEKIAKRISLLSGDTKSCGCLLKEKIGKRNKNPKSETYTFWCNLRHRKLKFPENWQKSYDCFYDDVGSRPNKNFIIKPINLNLPISKDNFKWEEKDKIILKPKEIVEFTKEEDEFLIDWFLNKYINRSSYNNVNVEFNNLYSKSYSTKILRDRITWLRKEFNIVKHFIGFEFKNNRDEIIQDYENGVNIKDIAEKQNVCSETISKYLKKLNIPIKSRADSGQKYNINKDFFYDIHSKEFSYYFGWMMADGCVTNSTIAITLQERDKYILDYFNSLFGGNRPLGFRKKGNDNQQNAWSLRIGHKNIVEHLISLGLLRRKSLILTFPTWILKENYQYFIRGYFEGDGCVIISKYNKVTTSFIGTLEFLTFLQTFFETNLNIVSNKIIKASKSNSNTFSLRFNHINSKQLYEFLYEDLNVQYLTRKYDKLNKAYQLLNN